jgi:hypothetical protein
MRRNVSAEALAMREDQQMRGFGAAQNPIAGWAYPVLFLWHMPLPGFPTQWSLRDITTSWANRIRYGSGESWGTSAAKFAREKKEDIYRFVTPWNEDNNVFCKKCGHSGPKNGYCPHCSGKREWLFGESGRWDQIRRRWKEAA